ncbi:MBL fold metallo-hydrolase [Prauserella sp. PE36]|uniref:MBL fold metallo-hydrolase n=1 Tax=Prauserella endophytica TaxID=1592324 RepID=A0ABY2S1V9_9PSEU|nr:MULTISPECIES: MBL fold metallo-hydrolase [Prauserella]RBM23467.1 MBL fold metallo-hydrolase [Prauserella sp. PE36]TKG69200.1 MBL fold metallo-hydrolase [Prauserella endophytica]
MDIVELTDRLHLLRFDVGQAYLWRDADGLTLVDAGPRGQGMEIRRAVEDLGGQLRRIVITHAHGDHTGSLAEVRAWSDATVSAHRLDAPYVRSGEPVSPPVLEDWERPLFEAVSGHLAGPPAELDVEVDDGDDLGFGDGAVALWVPGHTEGSIAVHLPAHGVLFTGDTVAEHGGDVLLGVFNQDRERTVAALKRLAVLDPRVVCFGHGEPLTSDAGATLRAVAGGY